MSPLWGLDLRGRERRVMNTETTVKCHCSNKRKDDRSFIKENSRVKKDASEMRDFCRVEPNSVLTQ